MAPLSDLASTVRQVKGKALVGSAELPELLGVSRPTSIRYARRPDFPEPLERLASGPVWARADIERWAKENLPLRRGRPPLSG
ncbi:MAG: prophage regulatory protein [Gaiellaceae bacterium]|nr:prophage regulatory protein [Gaiellaceae bacterium]